MAALAGFAAALLLARRAAAAEELAQGAGVVADGVITALRNAHASGRRLTRVEQEELGPRIRGTPELGEILSPRPGFFLVLDQQDKLLYSSAAVRHLSTEDQDELILVSSVRLRVGGQAAIVPVTLGDSLPMRVLIVARAATRGDTNISRVVAGLPTDVAELSPQLLVGSFLAVAPLVVIVGAIIAYLVAGGAFRPVALLINEVEAITDGRSLHRRLPTDPNHDELARLTATLNAMIGRLETSFAALRRFTADASHELKTPLAVLRADVERAMHPGTTGTDRLVALEEALQEVARMSDLVESLLTLARADEGRFDLHRAPVELEPLVREVYETAVILGESAALTIELLEVEPAVVLGDRGRLRQLFLNIVTNAIKYTPKGGRVEISLAGRPHGEVAFVVRDTGIGIAGSDLPYVFERFWRADRARSRVTERAGSGLGLAISQWIVHAHGGTIQVQSRLGRGSVFTVILPVAAEAAPGGVTDGDARGVHEAERT